MRRLVPRLGLIGRVMLALAVVGLLPIAVVSFGLVDLNRRSLEDQTLQSHSTVARTAATRLESLLGGWRIAGETMTGNPILDQLTASRLLSGLLGSQPDLLAASLVNADGELIVRGNQEDFGDEASQLLASAAGLSWLAVSGSGGDTRIRIDLPLTGERGFLRLLYRSEPIAEILYVPEFGESADLVLATADGTVITGTTESLAGFPQALIDEAASQHMIGAKRDLMVDDQRYLGAYAPVEDSDWFILSLQPSAFAEAIAYQLRKKTLWAVAIAILLTGAISLIAYGSLVRPIRGLLSAQRGLAGLTPAGAGNEITQLQETFALLQRRLRDKQDLGEVMLGRYQIIEVIGEGGMGTVFRAWDPQLQRQVALKTVRVGPGPASRTQAEMLASLSEEAIASARINHEGIVAVYDFIKGDEVAFIAMEYVDGVTLTEYIKIRGVLSAEATIRIGAAMARALAAAHGRDIVHCDVKPSNILITQDGAIKLADFGVAHFLSTALKEQDKVVGTPGFMPPEALLGEGYSPAGDLFALGAVLYTCLQGELPFPGGTNQVIIAKTLNGIDEEAQRLPEHLPLNLKALVFALLASDPRQRPGSAQEVVDRLSTMGFDLTRPWLPDLAPPAEEYAGLVLRLSRLSTLQRPRPLQRAG
jgi:hypothetical protein